MTTTPRPTSTEWGTILEAAEHFGVHTRTVRRWIAMGELKARRIGPRLIRVRLDRVDDIGRPMQREA